MKFEWTEETIRFREDAAVRVQFDAAIAQHILPFLPENAHVCDAGCGLGFLSLALAPHCRRITAVDVSSAALAVLARNAVRMGYDNIQIVQGDLFAQRPNPRYDAMVFCFFGHTKETLKAVRTQCKGHAILVKRDHIEHRFAAGNQPAQRLNFQTACQELTALHVPHTTQTFSLEMGQPFRSREEAARFFAIYGGSGAHSAMTQMEEVMKTGDLEFPYYFSARCALGLIVLDAGEIPDLP